MKKGLRITGTILLAVVFVISAVVATAQLRENRLAEQAYEDALDIALSAEPEPSEAEPVEEVELTPAPVPLIPEPEPEETPEPEPVEEPKEELPEEAKFLLDIDLNALREVNGDVIGWICIPDTAISYPLLKSEDNNEYLKLTWDLEYSRAGSIFMERRSSVDFSDFHTLIYGHNLQDGKMFSTLMKHREQEYFDSHPNVYIVTDDAILRYEAFSAYVADVVSDSYRLLFDDDAHKQSVIDFYIEKSETESEIVPAAEDKILSLSTCTGWGNNDIRCIVHTVQTGVFER